MLAHEWLIVSIACLTFFVDPYIIFYISVSNVYQRYRAILLSVGTTLSVEYRAIPTLTLHL